MRYAVISDVHSNLESLQAAFALMRPDDRVLCLGDMVGYCANPNECVRLIRKRAEAAVLGNHDVAAIENFGVEYFNPLARRAIEWTQMVIDPESTEWLRSLSYELRRPDFLLVHGAPVNYFEYIMGKREARAAFERTDAALIFIGHTHIAEYYALDEDGEILHGHMQNGGDLQLDPGKRYIIDVGSVGQPRDLNPRACFVFYEPESRRIEWVRYDYPIKTVQQKILDADLPSALATRLDQGR